MPDAFAEAWKIPAIPKSASLRTLWADDISRRAKALLKATHGRKRTKWRKNMSTVVKNLEKKRAHGIIRAFINSAMRLPTKSGLSTELTVEDYIEEHVDISRIYPLLTTPLSHLLHSCPLLTPLPTFHSATSPPKALSCTPNPERRAPPHAPPSDMKSRIAHAKSRIRKNTKRKKQNSCSSG